MILHVTCKIPIKPCLVNKDKLESCVLPVQSETTTFLGARPKPTYLSICYFLAQILPLRIAVLAAMTSA